MSNEEAMPWRWGAPGAWVMSYRKKKKTGDFMGITGVSWISWDGVELTRWGLVWNSRDLGVIWRRI